MSDSENEKWDKKDVYMKGNDSDFIEDEKEAVEIQTKRLNRLISKNLVSIKDDIHPSDDYILNKNIETKQVVKGENKEEIFNNFLDDLENNKMINNNMVVSQKISKKNKQDNININNKVVLSNKQLPVYLDKKENGLKIMNEKNRQMILKANKELAKGRGMYRKRKRKQGNARLMNKIKFQSKEKKRRNYVKEYTEKPLAYTGEATGIRRDLVRSVKFKD
jgi:U3 small nucleolar ribonucleoprotein protein LCP5